ncbi:MAG: MMPL family transporter [Planctomycetaceae bacterium]|jgi:predicted RND superfamily exporter protein|nr:MMPL family transporter [Planctomycetaceae bacterium]
MREFLNRKIRWIILFGSIPVFLFLLWSDAESKKRAMNRVSDWLPQGTQEIKDFNEHFYPHFPEGELLMISWKNCRIDDERIDIISGKLLAEPQPDTPAYFRNTITTRSVREELKNVPGINPQTVNRRLQGWLIGKNEKDACIVAVVNYNVSRKDAVRYVYQAVTDITGLMRDDIYIAGPTIDSVAIDDISSQSQKILLPFFLFLCFLLLLLCLRHFYAAVLVFFVAVTNEALGGAMLYWTNAHVDSISMLIASLTYVLTISGGVHLINYYRETLHDTDEAAAPRIAYKKALLPCTLAAVTTVFGLGSLAIGRMIPIRTFGIFASLALTFGTLWLFLFVFSALQQHPVRSWRRKALENPEGTFHHQLALFWERAGKNVYRFRRPLFIVSSIVFVFFLWQCKNLKTTVTFHGMMPKHAKVIRDYNHLEDIIGGLIPVEIMLQVPDSGGSAPLMIDQVNLVSRVRDSLQGIAETGAVISVLNFLPAVPPPNETGVSAAARRSALSSILQKQPERLTGTHFFNRSDAEQATFWRLSLRTYAQMPIDYAQLLNEIRQRIQSVQNTVQGGIREGGAVQFEFFVTGGVPLAHRAQSQLLSDLIYSFLTAFVLIAVSLIILLRGILRGLLAMVPNLFPCVLVFGAMGWLGYPVDIGSMMTASVAMGISVDGTLHFVTWFQRGLEKGLSRQDAVISAYRHCATALVQTTIICGGGMLVFGLSEFIPVSRFSVLLFLLLTASLIGDIIVFPAILFVRFGKVFETQKQP